MTNPKSGKPKKIAPEVKAQLEPRYETLRLLREVYQSPVYSSEASIRPQITGWPQSPIHPELRNASIEIALRLGNDALHERDDLRQLVALLDPIVRRDLEILRAQIPTERENKGGRRPTPLPEGWEKLLKKMCKDHPSWPLKRLDYEAALVFEALPATVEKARQAAARKAKKEK